MLREPQEGWGHWPPDAPLPPEPAYRGLHPIRKGAAAVWGIVGVVGFAFIFPFALLAAGAGYIWWEGMQWLTREP